MKMDKTFNADLDDILGDKPGAAGGAVESKENKIETALGETSEKSRYDVPENKNANGGVNGGGGDILGNDGALLA